MSNMRRMLAGSGSDRGFTLVEVTIILLVLVILSMIMLPQLGNFNRLARKVKVSEDLGAICATMKKFLDEVMVRGPYSEPGGGMQTPSDPIGILLGPGLRPALATGITSTGFQVLGAPSNAILTETPDVQTGDTAPVPVSFDSDLLVNHLQFNDPWGTDGDDPGDTDTFQYKNQFDLPSVGPYLGWRGPYFDMITSDPWGYRYAINTFALHTDAAGNIFSSAVVCYSSGPDGIVNTNFNQPASVTPFGWVTGGDDHAAVLSAWGPF